MNNYNDHGYELASIREELELKQGIILQDETTIELLRLELTGARREIMQFCEVAGLSPIIYPNGRRLPDANLNQDPAFLALVLGSLELENSHLRSELEELKELLILVNHTCCGHPALKSKCVACDYESIKTKKE